MKNISWLARDVLRNTSRTNVPMLEHDVDALTFLDDEGYCNKKLLCPDGKYRTPHAGKKANWHAYVDTDGDRWALRCPEAPDNTH